METSHGLVDEEPMPDGAVSAAHQSWPAGPPAGGRRGHLAEFASDRLPFLRRVAAYGDFVPLRIGRQSVVYLGDPAYVEVVTSKRVHDYSKDYLKEIFHPILRRQMMLAESDDWLEQRRLVQPLLHPQRMDAYGETMRELAERIGAEWSVGTMVDVAQAMRRLTLEILAQTVFDVDVVREAAEVGAIVDRLLDDMNRRIGRGLRVGVPLPTPRNLRLAQGLRRIDQLLDHIIDERRAQDAAGDDLLSQLVASADDQGRPLSNQDVKLTALPVFFAGHDTTANALTWTLYALGRHGEVRQRVLDELEHTLGDRPVTNADLRALPYLGNVIHEALRLYPPSWGFGRLAVRDTEIGPYRIPRGTTVFVSPWVLHRDPRWFDDPESFRPERWQDGLAHQLPRCAYIPFASGPRRCPGNTFATVESMVVLATLLRRHQLIYEPAEQPKEDPSMTLRPKGGLRMRVAG